MVRHCPRVVVLATSREGLGVEGEQLWPVPPLPVEDAMTLFVERARAASPDFRLDAAAVGAVTAICHRLDGLPLGIELAAARMRVMNPAEAARRLEDSPLIGGGRGSVARHQSLLTAIEWSFRLLSEPEQRLFSHMSVFAGGADLRGVHRVAAPLLTEDCALDLITGLVDRSMIVVEGDARSRYRVLETLRAYGRSHSERENADATLGRRHAAYYTELAERAAHGLQGPDERSWVDQALADYDNMRAAFQRASDDGDTDLAVRLVAAMPELVHLRIGYEASGWAEHVVDAADPDHPQYAAAVGAAARGAWNRGEFARARTLAHRAEGRVPPAGTARIAYPGDVLADVALYEGQVDLAVRHYTAESLRARSSADPIRLVWTLYYVAVCQAVRRDPQLGITAARESLDVADTTANPTAQSMARYALGLVLKKSEPDRALALFDEASELAASVGNFWWRGIALMEAAATRAVHGDPVASARAFVEVLDHWDRVGDRTQQWLNLRYVVRLLARVGAATDATALHGFLVAAGKPSPLGPSATPPADARGDLNQSEAAAVARARVALARFA